MEIPTGYAQCNLLFSGAALPTNAEVALGFKPGIVYEAPSEVGDAVLAAYISSGVKGMMTGECKLSGILTKFGPTVTGPSALTPASVIGSSTGTAVAANTALLVHKSTELGGRAGRGRSFFPGLPETQVNADGTLNGTELSALGAIFATFYSDLLTADLTPVVLHGATSPITTPTPVNAFIVDPKVATQRRRLRR